MGLQSRWIPGATSIVVFRTMRILGYWMKEGNQMLRKRDKKSIGHTILGEFTTYELKRELRRRRREGGLVRWILWRLKWM